MGIRENLVVNFEGKTLEYQDKKFYILKQFDYEGKTYLYGIDVDVFYKENERIEIAFIYRTEDDMFNHVTDNALMEDLFNVVSGICTADMVKKNLETYSSNN